MLGKKCLLWFLQVSFHSFRFLFVFILFMASHIFFASFSFNALWFFILMIFARFTSYLRKKGRDRLILLKKMHFLDLFRISCEIHRLFCASFGSQLFSYLFINWNWNLCLSLFFLDGLSHLLMPEYVKMLGQGTETGIWNFSSIDSTIDF